MTEHVSRGVVPRLTLHRKNMDIQDIIDKITECAEANGWHVHTERYRDTDLWLFEFSQYTKAGQDFNFSAEMRYADPETLIKSVREYYENYDPDEEAYLWIGDDGHGKNGAPYHISDIVADMEDAESMVGTLLEAFEGLDFDPCGE